jgi:NADPH-dependent glutamate synthase beta subunit-like oxidoreductase
VEAGVDLSARYLIRSFDAVVIAAGAALPRDLNLPGRELPGIYFALEYLSHQNRLNSGELPRPDPVLNAAGRKVVVLGGGDTGADCVGTARRQGAERSVQVEIMPRPPDQRSPDNPWPTWPNILRSSTSHEEGCERVWSVSAREFIGSPSGVEKIKAVKLDWSPVADNNSPPFREIYGSDFDLAADLVIIAAGFIHADPGPLAMELELELNKAGNISVDDSFAAGRPGVFAAGDCVRGASLVVHAIDQGRRCASAVNYYLHNPPFPASIKPRAG